MLTKIVSMGKTSYEKAVKAPVSPYTAEALAQRGISVSRDFHEEASVLDFDSRVGVINVMLDHTVRFVAEIQL